MRFALCSFGRSLLNPTSSPRASLRRTVRAVLAARSRWPGGRFVLSSPLGVSCPVDPEFGSWCGWLFVWRGICGGWTAPDGCYGVSFGTRRSDREWFVLRPRWLGGERIDW